MGKGGKEGFSINVMESSRGRTLLVNNHVPTVWFQIKKIVTEIGLFPLSTSMLSLYLKLDDPFLFSHPLNGPICGDIGK